MAGTDMMQVQATKDRWVNLVGSDGRTKARLNLDTGELVIKLRGECHKWPVRELLQSADAQKSDTVLNQA
jgi:hypothetical protein